MRKFLFGVLSVIMVIPNSYALDLSLNDAIEKIVAESNDLKTADANVKKATAQLSAVNANRWMSIDGTVSFMNLINPIKPTDPDGIKLPSDIGAMLGSVLPIDKIPDNFFSAGIQMTQPIYTFGKIGNAAQPL